MTYTNELFKLIINELFLNIEKCKDLGTREFTVLFIRVRIKNQSTFIYCWAFEEKFCNP